jgi:hypothetical protein
VNWGQFAAIGLMCFIFGLTWEAFDFWGAVIGRSIGGYFMAQLHQQEATAQFRTRQGSCLHGWPPSVRCGKCGL